MRFLETRLLGVFVVELDRHGDERGFFARSYCEREFAGRGLHTRFPQCNVSFNARSGTLRGMHFQASPHGEVKLVRCTAGAIWDVVVDLRPDSPTRLGWLGVELTAEMRNQLYIPTGFAHGFLTLRDDTEIFYQMGECYVPAAARGFRWDDPMVAIPWPAQPAVISERDEKLPSVAEVLGEV